MYCDFYSTTGKENRQMEYVDAVLHEYKLRQHFLNDKKIQTVYFGGGTPSILAPALIKKMLDGFQVMPLECTIECNPDDITVDFVHNLVSSGVNRFSIGVQTFSDARLKFLNRRHNSCQIYKAVDILRNSGVDNISIDLMFGFPDETFSEWEKDIDMALSMNVEHISAYSLMYEEGTRLTSMLNNGCFNELDEETCLQMYEMLIDKLTLAGYEHYEISNFAKHGFRSKHNSCYWNGTEYIGLGAAAHSYNGIVRQWNISNVDSYIRQVYKGIIPAECEIIDETTKYNDTITTALRTCEGIAIDKLKQKFQTYLMDNARRSLNAELLMITSDNHLKLTRKGLFVNNEVMTDLIWA